MPAFAGRTLQITYLLLMIELAMMQAALVGMCFTDNPDDESSHLRRLNRTKLTTLPCN
jgi:hypothetical protein